VIRSVSRFLRPLWLILVVGQAAAPPALAVAVQDLYEAEVQIGQDNQAQRAAAFREAMGIVLVRVTGRPDAASDTGTEDIRRVAERFVQQYRMTREGMLWVSFDAAALDAELARRGLPIWGAERPAVLLVLAVDQGGGQRFVLSAEDEVSDPITAELRDKVMSMSRYRGLPLVLPLMDAQDRSVISFSEAWGGFEQALSAAAARYGTDSVLLGRLTMNVPDRARWTLFYGDQSYRWTGDIDDGINGASDQFAQRYAVTTGAAVEGEVGLAVTNISSLADYGRVLSYLEGLTAVRSVNVRRLQDDSAVFGLQLIGSLENLDRAIRLGNLLQPATGVGLPFSTSDMPGVRPVSLIYRLLP
jgi:hypothetical protein